MQDIKPPVLEHASPIHVDTELNGLHTILPPEEEPKPKSFFDHILAFLSFILEILQILVIVGVLSFLIRMFIVQPFFVIGSSMEPALLEKDLLLIDEISYRFTDPQRGEIVVIHPPRDTRDYIKRIVGLPGDFVRIDENGVIFINNVSINETYLSADNQFTKGQLNLQLDNDEYFLLGDNRKVSNDSRGVINSKTSFAENPWTIRKEDIVGRAFLRFWPPERITFIKSPTYN